MPVYAYKGVTAAGQGDRGLLDAESSRSARAKLRRDGVVLTEIAEQRRARRAPRRRPALRRFALPSFQRISPLDLALVTRQAATLIGAGIPARARASRALTEQIENPRLKSVLGQVRDRVNEGASFADALAQTGSLPGPLRQHGARRRGRRRARDACSSGSPTTSRARCGCETRSARSSSIPCVMFGFAMLVVGVLVTVVLPQITELLTSLDQPLPFYTRWIIDVSNFAREFWWALILARRGRGRPGAARGDPHRAAAARSTTASCCACR